ncbi:MAG TPA: beta-aspartyl-peptidase [Alphaproteobacteria bacterium]|nr:beta-aspartyl-peptidase [Alphaproteobacteria bacterium]
MLTLLRVKEIHTPEPSQAHDIFIADGRIAALGDGLGVPKGVETETFDFPEGIAVPGFIDQHAHVTGGGGEGGFSTRCPPISAEEVVAAGFTTIVGLLGTDSISRSPADLLAKTRGLREQGIEAYMYTGAYRVPPPTLTGDIQRDIAWIPEVIGVGEIAISDHRSSQPTQAEIERLVSEARIGGMLSRKRGIVHFHLGSGARGLAPLKRLLSETEIPADQIIPTHVNRHRRLLEESADYAKTFGAAVDITAFEFPGKNAVTAVDAVHYLLDQGVPIGQITMSSDCNGSLPEFDEKGELVGMRVATNTALLADWQRLARSGRLAFGDALALITRNIARVIGMAEAKGRLATGADADITVLDRELKPVAVFVKGRRLL